MFAVAFMFLTVHPDFYMGEKQFDATYCYFESGTAKAEFFGLISAQDSLRKATTDFENERWMYEVAVRQDRSEKARLHLEAARAFQRKRMLKGEVVKPGQAVDLGK